MKMKRFKKALAAVMLLVTCCASTVFAAEPLTQEDPMENRDKQGTINIQLTDEKEENNKSGIRFYCLKVADVVNGEYVLEADYQQSNVDLNTIENAESLKEAAEKLAGYENKDGQSEITDEKGCVSFSNLEVGVYLVYAEDKPSYDVIESSLVAIPMWDEVEENMMYEVNVEPKHTPRPETPSNTVPQTGLQEKTFYYLAGAGFCLLMSGHLVVKRKKRKK